MNPSRATFNKLSSRSYVYQNKAKIMCKCVKGGASLQCVNTEQFKVKWLQTIYHVKWSFTKKQIPRQNE